jgi:hypothetical protein
VTPPAGARLRAVDAPAPRHRAGAGDQGDTLVEALGREDEPGIVHHAHLRARHPVGQQARDGGDRLGAVGARSPRAHGVDPADVQLGEQGVELAPGLGEAHGGDVGAAGHRLRDRLAADGPDPVRLGAADVDPDDGPHAHPHSRRLV